MRFYTATIGCILFSTLFASAQPDWATGVAPILYRNCTNCHHPGGIGPFSLMTYQDAYDHAGSIANAVSNGSMPPWSPDTTYQRYTHERTISAQEINDIQQWVSNGMPSGNWVDAPNPPLYASTSQLDSISMSMRIPTFTVNSNQDVYRNFVLPTGLTQAAYATALEIVPGNTAIVHHVLVFQDSTNNTISSTSSGGTGSAASQLIFGYTPGASPYYTPVGTGFRLPANTRIILQMHYAPGSLGQVDSTRINLKIASGNLRQIAVSPLLYHSSPSLLNGPLSIPANTTRSFDEEFRVLTGNYTLLYAFPHMHLIGRSIYSYGLKPVTNDTIPFVRINDWDFHWQDNFVFRNTLRIPNGTLFKAHAFYDNTSNNPDNPSDPPINVSLGESTLDEMMLVFFAYLPYQSGDENMIVDKRITVMGAKNICSGQTVLLKAIQGTGYTYQWYYNNNPISGATNYYYTAGQTGAYKVSISLGTNNAVSEPVNITVFSSFTATITPSGFNLIAPFDSLQLNAGTGSGFTYQWFNNGNPIPGANGPSYWASLEADYTVMINNGGCNSMSPVATVSYLNTGMRDPLSKQVLIYPNPTGGPLTIDVGEEMNLDIIDINGKNIGYKKLHVGKNELFLERTGSYTLRFTTKDGKEFVRKVNRQ